MAVFLSPVGGAAAQFFDNNGVILTGGKIYTYAAGSSTPQATYTSSSGATAHSNPIILDASGRVPGGEIWLTENLSYKFLVKDANEVLIGTYDNLYGLSDVVLPIDSSMITYDPPFTGSVPTNVEARLAQTASMKDFGAVGDGVTDDTAAIQSAVNAAGARLISLPTDVFLCTSAITIANTSVEIIGGVFQFTSNNGFVFTSNNSEQFFTVSNATITSKSPASGAALSASWTGASNIQALQISNLIINGNSSINYWNTGIVSTNCVYPIISGVRIYNTSAITNAEYGIKIMGDGVTSLINKCFFSNIDTGVYYGAKYNNTVQECVFNPVRIGIRYDYAEPGYGAIAYVQGNLFYPTEFGILGNNVIAFTISNNFFQKENASTWVGIQLIQTKIPAAQDVFESNIINNQFGNNSTLAPWTGIKILSGRVILIQGNQFDSVTGTSISFADGTVTEMMVLDNYNMQEQASGGFISNSSVTNKIINNISIQTYMQINGDDVATTNPPNFKEYLGDSQNGFWQMSNSGGATNVNGITGGTLWQQISVYFAAGNITLVNATPVSVGGVPSSFNLQGAANYNPATGTVMTFIATPSKAWVPGVLDLGIIWFEIARRTP